jgi:hypothetical protein
VRRRIDGDCAISAAQEARKRVRWLQDLGGSYQHDTGAPEIEKAPPAREGERCHGVISS